MRRLLLACFAATAAAVRDDSSDRGAAAGACDHRELPTMWGDFLRMLAHAPDRIAPDEVREFKDLAASDVKMEGGGQEEVVGAEKIVEALRRAPAPPNRTLDSHASSPVCCENFALSPTEEVYTAYYAEMKCTKARFDCSGGTYTLKFFGTLRPCPSEPGLAASQEACKR
mmetsp:Transcript_37636/g.117292  ORF Transcript_37636/g.117292 Transcript_37636/m.117292 type:complete len:170 (-) Transcript_37636:8-517(-)